LLALIGFSRFPIFLSANGRHVLGHRCPEPEFQDYVASLASSRPSVAIKALGPVELRRRFVIRNMAVNPRLRRHELVPRWLYVWPDEEPEEIVRSAYAHGALIFGPKRPIFLPLIYLKPLTQDEARAISDLARLPKAAKMSLKALLAFLSDLGIEVIRREFLASGEVLLALRDPEVSEPYEVLIGRDWRVLDANFCVSLSSDVYLPELVMLVREQKRIFILGRLGGQLLTTW